MVTPKNTKASKNSNTNNQHKSKARNKPKQNEWEIQRTHKFRTQTIQKKMVQTKLIKTIKEDKTYHSEISQADTIQLPMIQEKVNQLNWI